MINVMIISIQDAVYLYYDASFIMTLNQRLAAASENKKKKNMEISGTKAGRFPRVSNRFSFCPPPTVLSTSIYISHLVV